MTNYTDKYLAPGFVTATSAAPDWQNSTSYGAAEIVTDPESGRLYRAASGHTSPASGLFIDDVGNWEVVGSASNGTIITAWEAFTPTISTATFHSSWDSSLLAFWRRNGENLEIQFSAVQTSAGTAGSGDYQMTLPNSLTINNSIVNSSHNAVAIFGTGTINQGTTYDLLVSRLGASTDKIILRVDDDAASMNTWSSGFGSASTSTLSVGFSASIPVTEWANEGITVPITDLTEQTKWVDENVVSVSDNNIGGGTYDSATFMATKDSNGVYWLEYSINISGGTSATSHLLTLGLGGVTFPNLDAGSQGTNSAGGRVFTNPGTADIDYNTATAGSTVRATGKAQLSGKPSWFDANRENPASVAAYIPEATSSQAGIVKKNKYIVKHSTSIHSSTANGQLSLTNIPDGTYKVTVGCDEMFQGEDDSCYIVPQLNSSNIILGGGALWEAGLLGTGGLTGEQGRMTGFTSTRIITFSNGTNSFDLDLIVSGSSSLKHPMYILEKLDNMEDVGSDWD